MSYRNLWHRSRRDAVSLAQVRDALRQWNPPKHWYIRRLLVRRQDQISVSIGCGTPACELVARYQNEGSVTFTSWKVDDAGSCAHCELLRHTHKERVW